MLSVFKGPEAAELCDLGLDAKVGQGKGAFGARSPPAIALWF